MMLVMELSRLLFIFVLTNILLFAILFLSYLFILEIDGIQRQLERKN